MLLGTLHDYLSMFMKEKAVIKNQTNIVVTNDQGMEYNSLAWLEKEGMIKILDKSKLKGFFGIEDETVLDVEATIS